MGLVRPINHIPCQGAGEMSARETRGRVVSRGHRAGPGRFPRLVSSRGAAGVCPGVSWLPGGFRDGRAVGRGEAAGCDGFGDQPVDQRADGDLIPLDELRLLDHLAVDSHAVATAQVSDQHPIIGNGHAAMAAGNLREIDPDVALGMAADQENGPLHRRWAGCSPCRWGSTDKSFRKILRRRGLRDRHGRFTVGFLFTGHLNDDLDAALLGDGRREDLANRGSQRVLIRGERRQRRMVRRKAFVPGIKQRRAGRRSGGGSGTRRAPEARGPQASGHAPGHCPADIECGRSKVRPPASTAPSRPVVR